MTLANTFLPPDMTAQLASLAERKQQQQLSSAAQLSSSAERVLILFHIVMGEDYKKINKNIKMPYKFSQSASI